jgi:hypothetical protein
MLKDVLENWIKDRESDSDYYYLIPNSKSYLLFNGEKIECKKITFPLTDLLFGKVEEDKKKEINNFVFNNSKNLIKSIFEN